MRLKFEFLAGWMNAADKSSFNVLPVLHIYWYKGLIKNIQVDLAWLRWGVAVRATIKPKLPF